MTLVCTCGDLVVGSVVCVLWCLFRVVLVLGCLAFGMCFLVCDR